MTPITPAARAAGASAYRRAAWPDAPVPHAGDLLRLDANEGPVGLATKAGFSAPADVLRQYPDVSSLERLLSVRLGVPAERLIVTAGGDDALQRACQAVLEPGASAVATDPTFEMIPRYVALAGGQLRQVPWMRGAFPVERVLAAITHDTRAVFVVTPNNPTGAVAAADDLRRISAHAPHALLVVDLAYTELADVDLTPVALGLPNAIIVRTFSKARGLAGLRVGYAAGSAPAVSFLRAVGQPYAVSGLSAAMASHALETLDDDVRRGIEQVRAERAAISALLTASGLDVLPSQANFVLALSPRAAELHAFLLSRGILVRSFQNRPGLDQALRITCPGDPAAFDRLVSCLEGFR